MHTIEPHWQWRAIYAAEDDAQSPFFQREYSELYYSHSVYDHAIHPQWDEFGSETLFIKILFVDYEEGAAIIEMIGEWNDTLNNDIMLLKRDVIDPMLEAGINQFVLVGENVLNFHSAEEDYYAEWFEDVEDGWISLLNFRPHILDDFKAEGIDQYLNFGGELDELAWARFQPLALYQKVRQLIEYRLGMPA